MTWLTPLIAGIAAAIAIPALVILYFLKLRRRDVEISSTFLWKKAIQDLQANAPFQKLRRNILLLLQLIALAAALLALGQPILSGRDVVGRKHVILIDRSASMNAMDEKNDSNEDISRLEQAKESARELIKSLREPGVLGFGIGGPGDEAMVVAFDHAARVVQPFTADKQALLRAIDSIDGTEAPTSVGEAYSLVEAQAPRQTRQEQQADGSVKTYEGPPLPVGTIHIYSDGRFPDASLIKPHAEDVLLYNKMGEDDATNVGVTSLRASRSLENPNQLSLFVGLGSTVRHPVMQEVELLVDGMVVAVKSVDVAAAAQTLDAAKVAAAASGGAAGGEASSDGAVKAPQDPAMQEWTPGVGGVSFTLDRAEGGVVMARLVHRNEGGLGVRDVLSVDDRAQVVVPSAKRLAVALVTTGSAFIPDTLAGKSLAKFETMTPAQFDEVKKDPTRLAGYDVMILHRVAPIAESGEMLPGRFLMLGGSLPSSLGVTDKGEVKDQGGATVISWSRDHPALRGLVLDGVFIGDGRVIDINKGSAVRSIATSDVGPAIVEYSDGGTRMVATTFDPDESSWPFELSFAVFMAQAIDVLGDATLELGVMVKTGEVVRDRVPMPATSAQVAGPEGSRSETVGLSPLIDGQVSIGPMKRTGIYEMSWSGTTGPTDTEVNGRAVRTFAVNLLDAAESDVTPKATLGTGTRLVSGQDVGSRANAKRLWPWLLLGTLAVLMLEWYIYNRRVSI